MDEWYLFAFVVRECSTCYAGICSWINGHVRVLRDARELPRVGKSSNELHINERI